MTVINPNSISGITSITMPSGSNVLTIHTTDGAEKFRIDSSGNVKVGSAATISPDGDLFVTGVCTATTLSGAASGLTGTLPALSAASLTSIPAANIVGVCTSGFSKTGGFGGNLVHISTQEITSNAATVTFSNAFSDYPFYKIIGINVRPEADSRDLYLRAQDSGGDMTSAHKSIVHGGGTEYTHSANSEFRLNYNSIGNAYSGSHLEEMCMFDITLTGFEANKSLRYTGLISYTGSDGASRGQSIMGVCNRSEAVVGLKFFMDSDVIGGGSNYNTKFILYGVNNA